MSGRPCFGTGAAGRQVEGHDLCVDDLFIHPMVHGTLHVHSGFRRRAMQETPRHPCVHINDAVSRNANDLPVLHHSVAERFRQVSGYRPHALRNLKFRLLLANGEITQEPVCGIGGLLKMDAGGQAGQMIRTNHEVVGAVQTV